VGTLSSRVSAGVAYACVFFAIVVALVGVAGVVGVRSATRAGNDVAHDELNTASVTAQLNHQLDTTYADGVQLALSTTTVQRTTVSDSLSNQQIPAVEAAIANLQRVHESDSGAEKADIAKAVRQWVALRTVLTSATTQPVGDVNFLTQLGADYTPLSDHVEALIAREGADADADQARASANSGRIELAIIGAALIAILLAAGVSRTASRRLRRAVEPAEDQVEFADTLQLAEDEDEAHHLLQRHLQRLVGGATVTVLNRNNSADRLEAVTELPPGSPLVSTLAHAQPRSCLAVRSGRAHDQDDQHPALLSCPVCTQCPGKSTCAPLTVGGEVIGSVLVNRAARYGPLERQQIRDSVGQAAPVLANLRNLAIAELRAATDSLTGLPNKRAVGDTLKRMLAQASRTEAPLSLIVLDLDHFKDVNDRFGHPVGDQVLANVGAVLQAVLRDSDFAGRNGGEEFAVMLPDTDIAAAVITAEKIRAAIADISLPGVDVAASASVGIAAYPAHALSTERLERLADSALYIAKRSGRDRIEIAAYPTNDTTTEAAPHARDLVLAQPPLVNGARPS
jgi:diguanylate cyclase (GGDEF)-like protein